MYPTPVRTPAHVARCAFPTQVAAACARQRRLRCLNRGLRRPIRRLRLSGLSAPEPLLLLLAGALDAAA
eukprot:2794953-Prymnesium_polylepis.1